MDPAVEPRDDGRSGIIDQSEVSILHHNTIKSILQNANFTSLSAVYIDSMSVFQYLMCLKGSNITHLYLH